MLVAALGALLFWLEPVPGPGPVALAVQIAIVHALLIAPSLGPMRWQDALWGSLLGLPFVLLCAWAQPLRDPLLIWVACVACGAAGQRVDRRWFLATMALLIALPFALGYLCREFGAPDSAATFDALSPLSLQLGPGIALLFVWPAIAWWNR